MEDTHKSKTELLAEIQTLRDRLSASEDILRAIKQGEVDALVISTPQGTKIFTLQSADLSYRLLVEEMQQGAVVLSTEGLILYCNKSFSNLLKQPLEKLIGSYFQCLISPQDTPLFQARVKQAERGERYPVELFLNTRNGVEVPVYLSINHLILDDTPINCVVITDLTEQKRHEKTLASEKLARLILEQAGEAILVCDDTGQIIRASAIAQELWGENLLFQPFDRLNLLYLFNSKFCLLTNQKVTLSAAHIDSETPIKVPFSIAPVLHGESYKGLEVEFERRDGQVLNLVLNARPLADKDNQFKGAVVILTNITQRKQAEDALQAAKNELEVKVVERTQELQETNDRLQLELFERERREKILQEQAQLLDLAHDAILTVDLNDVITFWNHGAAALYGFSVSEALGKNLATLLQTNFPKSLTEIKNELFEYGHWEGELIQHKKDGTLIFVASRWTVQRNLAGRPIEIMKINTDISKSKQAEKALIYSSLRLSKILDIAKDAIISIDQNQKITLFNKGAETIFGYKAAEVLGQDVKLLLPSRSASVHSQQVSYFSQSDDTSRKMGERSEIYGQRKDGTEFPAEASISKLELNGEKIYTTILRDITERKIAETALREREERFRQVFEDGPIGMAIVGLDYRFEKINPALCQMVGYTETEFKTMTFLDITHPDDLNMDLELAHQLFQGEIPFYKIEKRYFKKSKEIVWITLTGSIVRDEDGQPLYYLKMIEDISDRKHLEQELAIREAWLNAFFTYSPVGMAIVDEQLRFVQVNENAAKMSNLDIAQHLGKSLEELFPTWFPTLQPIYQQVLNTGESLFNIEVEGDDPRRPGSIGYWLVSYHPIFNLTREVIGVGYVAIDISDRKRAEEYWRQYERIVSTTTDGIVLINRNYIYQIANPAYLSWYNKSSNEVVGHSVTEIIGQELFKNLKPLLERCLCGEIIQYENWLDYPQAVRKFVSVTCTPYFAAKRDISGVVVSLRDLTQLKQAEESLQQSESTLRSFFNSGEMPMGIVELYDRDILHISDNWAAAQFFGNTPEAMQNQFASTLGVSPSTIQRWIGYYQQAEKTQAPVRFEYLHTNTDRQRWLAGSVSPIAVSPSGYSRFSYIVEDISDRKQAEQMLELQAAIARNMAEGICLVRADNGIIVHVNPKFEQMFGYDDGELNGQHVSILNYASEAITAQEVNQAIQAAVLQNREATYQVHNVKKDGNPFWCSATTSVFRHPEYGDVLVAVQQDISDRQQAESELRELNLALENAVEGIARLDTQGRYTSINRAYTEKCGYQLSEMLGMEWPPTVHPEDRPKMLAAYQEMLTKGKVEVEAKGLRKDGSTFYKQLVMISAYDRQNNFVGHYCFMKDITERKKAEVELAAAKEAAEAANRAKSEFLANMSHEIRTPMNAILGFSELLQGSIVDPQPLAYLNSIAASGRTLLALINDILDLSKIEAGKLQLQYEPVDVRSLIWEIQQILDQKAVTKGMSLLVEIDETVPTSILFDAIRLRQILFNTVGNALKFTESGFVKISVRAQPEPSPLSNRVQMEITIADTGIGICFDQQESIFEAFKQSEGQSTRKYGGTGLGLAITKRLTEMLGGTVKLQSEISQGSAFTFIFPNLTISETETRSVATSKLDEDLHQFPTATVLVVDDVQFNLDLITGYFAGSKHRLLFARDGQQALQVAQTDCPDVILMDLWMPNMDGLQATQLLKQNKLTKSIPIVIVTAISRSEDEATVRSLSQGFLRKPVSRSQLVSALKQILPQEANYLAVNEAPITPRDVDTITPNPNVLAKLPELIEKLRQEEESTWLKLCKTMKRRDIQAFVERLQEWAQEYQCQTLLDYTTTLESQLATFDWEQLPKTIENFPEVRAQLL